MKQLYISGLFFLFSVLGCRGTPISTQPTSTTQPIASPTFVVQPSPTDLPYPAPTDLLQPSTTSMPYPPPATHIQFEPGGTWIEVTGRGEAGQATSFVLSAMKDQVMSVSVFENYPISVQGRDGIFLTSSDRDNSYWRGTLPSTQDYLITINALSQGDFTLRVAINPPGQAEQIFEYNNPQYALGIKYSDSFAPIDYPYVDQQRGPAALAFNFIDSSFYEKTNLSEAFFVLNIFDDPNIVVSCSQPSYSQEQSQGQEAIGGYVFDKSTAGGVGAGNIYELTIYRTVQKDACIEIVFFIHYGNIGNYTPGTVTEFDAVGLIQKLMDVLQTFTLN